MSDDLAGDVRPAPTARLLNGVNQTRVIAGLCLGISVVVAVGTLLDLHYPGRALLTVSFALVVPGWTYMSYVRFAERLVEVTAGICVSISMGILLALAQVALGAWHPQVVVAVWAAVTALLALPQVMPERIQLRQALAGFGGLRR